MWTPNLIFCDTPHILLSELTSPLALETRHYFFVPGIQFSQRVCNHNRYLPLGPCHLWHPDVLVNPVFPIKHRNRKVLRNYVGNMCTAKWTDLMKLTNLKTAPGRYVLWLLLQNVFESNNKCWCTHYYHYSLCSHPAFWPIQSLQFCSWTIFTDLREIFLTDMIQHTYLQKSYGFIGIYVLVIFFSLRLKRYIGQFYPNHKIVFA